MTNPTTNFGWVMPTATDLVTDLPADFNVFGQAVDTSMAGLLGGTTGQILSKTSATNMAFTWIANDQGDITGVTAGTGITVTDPTGPVPTVAINTAVTADLTTSQTLTNKTLTSPALTTPTISTATTNGDLLYGTGSGALSRLGIGSTAQVLTVAAGVPSWATPTSGSLTLLSTTSLSGSTTTISSISGSYTNLVISIEAANITGTTGYFRIAPNGTTTASDGMYNSATGTFTGGNGGYILPVGLTAVQSNVTPKNTSITTIYNYASSAYNKPVMAAGMTDPTTSGFNGGFFFGAFVNNTAITSIVISTPAGTFTGSVKIYGVK